jgi:tetratricopeptide (TPR) repeat protein
MQLPSFCLNVTILISLLCATTYAASSSTQPVFSADAPLWMLPKPAIQPASSETEHIAPQPAPSDPERIVINLGVSGSRGIQSLQFPVTEQDYFSALSFDEHLSDNRGFMALALFQYRLRDGTIRSDIAHAPSFREFLLTPAANRQPHAHPIHRYPIIGHEYYLIERDGTNYTTTFLAAGDAPETPLVRHFLTNDISINNVITIGLLYQQAQDYPNTLKWFNWVNRLLQEYEQPRGHVYAYIIDTYAAQNRWEDVMRLCLEFLPLLRAGEVAPLQHINGYLKNAYRHLLDTQIAQAHFETAIELGHDALMAISKADPTFRSEITFKLGICNEQLQKAPLALFCYQQALENSTNPECILFQILRLLTKNKDHLTIDASMLHSYAARFVALSTTDHKKIAKYAAQLQLNIEYEQVVNIAEKLIVEHHHALTEQQSIDAAMIHPHAASSSDTSGCIIA